MKITVPIKSSQNGNNFRPWREIIFGDFLSHYPLAILVLMLGGSVAALSLQGHPIPTELAAMLGFLARELAGHKANGDGTAKKEEAPAPPVKEEVRSPTP